MVHSRVYLASCDYQHRHRRPGSAVYIKDDRAIFASFGPACWQSQGIRAKSQCGFTPSPAAVLLNVSVKLNI